MQPTERFIQDVARLTQAPARFGIAVSGGPDSMALVWLANRAFPGCIEAATVDHALRPQSADEAAMVARWCADHAIAHATLHPAQPITGNLQSAARAARYGLLEAWRIDRAIDWLMTAHHADDQLETLLMRLNRGSGVAGLAGVRARSGQVLRPLLGWRKAELLSVAQAEQLPFVTDPSNTDPRFDRASLRARLSDIDWLDALASTRTAAALAEAEDALQWLTGDLAARHITQDGDSWALDETHFPREVQRRLVLHMLALADPDAPTPRGDTLDAAIAKALAGEQASIGAWLLQGGGRWRLLRAPPRRS